MAEALLEIAKNQTENCSQSKKGFPGVSEKPK